MIRETVRDGAPGHEHVCLVRGLLLDAVATSADMRDHELKLSAATPGRPSAAATQASSLPTPPLVSSTTWMEGPGIVVEQGRAR